MAPMHLFLHAKNQTDITEISKRYTKRYPSLKNPAILLADSILADNSRFKFSETWGFHDKIKNFIGLIFSSFPENKRAKRFVK